MGISNKYSFVPKVTSATNQYSPNLEALENEEEQRDLLRGSFNPDYPIQGQEMIKDNYFNKSRDDLVAEDEYQMKLDASVKQP